ncbi:MAG: helix-turn-helix domain-containing protein [Rhodocyclales bacterium]|nr:helix-turn-helix domain-containing protein [Rhodocyclales bacterium]
MPRIVLVVEPGATPSSVTATLDIFNVANRFPGGDPCQVDVLSDAGGIVRLNDAVGVETKCLTQGLAGVDAVILPGFFATEIAGVLDQLQSTWRPVVAQLQALRGKPLVAASCYGTFVLAESGLLDGHRATTSWWFQGEFARRYPRVRLDADKALVDDGAVITAGAMTAHTELSMAVLRRLKGADLARSVGSIMLVGEGKSSQRPFMTVRQSFPDPLAQSAADWMAAQLARPFSADALAAACHSSYRNLHRRFSAAAGMSPQEYMQALRVERAKALLEGGRMSIEGIVAEIGYADVPSFRRLFSRLAGLSPAQYRRRFRRGE